MTDKAMASHAKRTGTDPANFWSDLNLSRPSFADQMAYYRHVARHRRREAQG